MREVVVRNVTRGSVLGDRIRIADTSLTRLFGLLSRSGLSAGEGLWIQPSSGVHTFFMRFTIDVVGLDRERKVIKLWPNLVPWRVTSVSTKLRNVIELPGGSIAASGTLLGDTLAVE
jgi:uncharacterized membrane protein (UPF0127 family)